MLCPPAPILHHTYITYRILLPYLYLHLEVSTIYIPNIHPSFPNTCISCVKRQYPSRTLKLSHIELCQYCRGGPDGKPGSCIPFYFFIQHSTMDQMDTPPEDPPRLESVDVVHTIVFFLSTSPSQSIEEGSTYVQT